MSFFQHSHSAPTSSYARACILSHARSGSNLLRSLLNSHPAIIAHGEPFKHEWDPGVLCWKQLPTPRITPSEDPVAYLERYVFPPEPEGKKAVLFKVFPSHIFSNPRWHVLWEYLQQPPMKVVYLHRENYLDIELSRVLALRMNHWFFVAPSQTLREKFLQPVKLQYEECIGAIERIHEWDIYIKRSFPADQLITVTYNDLINDTDACMKKLQTSLNVSPIALDNARNIERQRRLPKRDVIENFMELRDRCAREHPQWLPMFETDDSEREVPVSAAQSICV